MSIRNWLAVAPLILLVRPSIGFAQKAVAEVQVAPPSVTMRVGMTHRLSALAYDGGGNIIASGVRYVWSSNNVNVAQVDSLGTVTGVAAGSAVIRAEAAGSGNPPKRGEATIRVRHPGP